MSLPSFNSHLFSSSKSKKLVQENFFAVTVTTPTDGSCYGTMNLKISRNFRILSCLPSFTYLINVWAHRKLNNILSKKSTQNFNIFFPFIICLKDRNLDFVTWGMVVSSKKSIQNLINFSSFKIYPKDINFDFDTREERVVILEIYYVMQNIVTASLEFSWVILILITTNILILLQNILSY